MGRLIGDRLLWRGPRVGNAAGDVSGRRARGFNANAIAISISGARFSGARFSRCAISRIARSVAVSGWPWLAASLATNRARARWLVLFKDRCRMKARMMMLLALALPYGAALWAFN